MPAIGIGTWTIGGAYWFPDTSRDEQWVKAISYAITRGITLIDTAEMYGGGHAEELVGRAIKDFERESITIVDKVWPTNARYESVIRSAKSSVARLGTYIDIYLLHAPSRDVHICETVRAFERLIDEGLVMRWGVSNFSIGEIKEAETCAKRYELSAVQNRYSLLHRRDEADVIPYCESIGAIYMAYTPLEKGALARHPVLIEIARKHGRTPVQVALSWYASMGPIVPIPKAERKEHIDEIADSLEWSLPDDDWALIDRAFRS